MHRLFLAFFALLSIMTILTPVNAVETPSLEDKTLSPYFFVKSDDPELDQLPLLSTSAEVNIAGVIADVRVTQSYKNEGSRPIEAIYTFPASSRAAVYGMQMTIGERTIIAEIREREQARQEYEEAKQEGKSASLLEQQRPNVFQMNVANIMPGDTIKVELSYTELLVPTDGVYEFVYPTVVGPRYSNLPEESAPESENWIENPYTHSGEQPTYTFDISANLASGIPIQEMTCTSHKVSINYDGPKMGIVKLDESEKFGGNRDFILKYRLSGGRIESGLLLYEGKDENFFLMMVQPPKRVTPENIPPREYIFIVDVSGSMNGFPLDISKKLLRELIGNIRPTDVFNVLLFSSGNAVMSEKSLPATQENINVAIRVIESQQGGGGTELLPALKRALALPRTEGISRSVVIVTDGYVRVEAEAFDLIRENLGKANMFAFGIGSGVNRFIIEGMAHVGMGEPFVITNQSEAPAQADKFRKYIQSPVLTQIEANFGDFEVFDVEPLSIPDVLAERPIIVFGKWKGKSKGEISLKGYTGNEKYKGNLDVRQYAPDETNSALRYLWARHKIQILDDYNNLRPNDERIKEVTELGLKYNLLTQYTSFVAIDTEVRNVDGKQTTVKQVLPLPEGVSDYAIGGGQSKGMGFKRSSAKPHYSGTGIEYAVDGIPSTLVIAESEEIQVIPIEPISLSVTIGQITIGEGITSKAVNNTLEGHLSKIERCYSIALAKQSGLKGKIVFKFIIQSDGKVSDVEAESNELNEDMAKCIIKVIEKIEFAIISGKDIEVSVPITFTF